MMLTSDMCLAYKNNVKFVECQEDIKSNDQVGWQQNGQECIQSLYGLGVDLDPKEVDCCAWTK